MARSEQLDPMSGATIRCGAGEAHMIRFALAAQAFLAASLLGCAHGPPSSATAHADDVAQQPEPIREGDSLAEVRRKLGGHATEEQLSPTEKMLSALYSAPCPDIPAEPTDLSRPACGVGQLLTIRLRIDRVVSLEWGDPRSLPEPGQPVPGPSGGTPER
jgi:hypothetical protein